MRVHGYRLILHEAPLSTLAHHGLHAARHRPRATLPMGQNTQNDEPHAMGMGVELTAAPCVVLAACGQASVVP